MALESPSKSFQGHLSSTKHGFEFANSFRTDILPSLQPKTLSRPETSVQRDGQKLGPWAGTQLCSTASGACEVEAWQVICYWALELYTRCWASLLAAHRLSDAYLSTLYCASLRNGCLKHHLQSSCEVWMPKSAFQFLAVFIFKSP